MREKEEILNKNKPNVPENKMKEFRRQLGLSQEDVASSSLIERTRFQRIENQKAKPSKEEMEFISEAPASTVEECFPGSASIQKTDIGVGQGAQTS